MYRAQKQKCEYVEEIVEQDILLYIGDCDKNRFLEIASFILGGR